MKPTIKEQLGSHLGQQTSCNTQKEDLVIADGIAECLRTIERHVRSEMAKKPKKFCLPSFESIKVLQLNSSKDFVIEPFASAMPHRKSAIGW